MVRRRIVLWLSLMGVVALFASACGSGDPTATPTPTAAPAQATPAAPMAAWELEWEELAVAAREEGELTAFICCIIGRGLRTRIGEFEEQYGIKVTHSFTGSSSQQAERVLAEQAAGTYALDIWMGGETTANTTLIPNGALQPLKPLLFLPEILDESAWWEGNLAWVDPDERSYLFAFVGNGQTADIAYNTELVDPDQIKSYWDLLRPEWKGKLAIRDPRFAGTAVGVGYFYLNPELGPEFLRRLLAETDITVSGDQRELNEWVALGKFQMCLMCAGRETRTAKEQGLPIAEFPNILAEGAALSHGGGVVYAVNNPPHPNVQKLFINWWLSREGQMLMQDVSGFDSLRVDIPKDTVDPAERRREEVSYSFYSVRDDFQEKLLEAQVLATEALASAE